MIKSFYGGYETIDGRLVKIEDVDYPDWLNDIDLAHFFRKTRPSFQLLLCIFDHEDCTDGISHDTYQMTHMLTNDQRV